MSLRVEGRAREGTDAIRRLAGNEATVSVRAQHRRGRAARQSWAAAEQLGRKRGLPPAHHLRVEPCSLHGIGAARTLPSDEQVAIACPHIPSGRHLQAAVERAPDDLGGDADAAGRGEDDRPPRRDCARILDERSGLLMRPHEPRQRCRGFSSAHWRRTASSFSAARAQDLGDEMQDARRCRGRPPPSSTVRRRRSRRRGRWQGSPPCRAAAAPPAAHPRRDRRRRPPSRSAGDSCAWRRERSCRRSADPAPSPCALATTRASARADTIGSRESPSAASAMVACKGRASP